MATVQEQDFFVREILLTIGKNANKLPKKPITGFLAMQGAHYNNELMVVGRAPNGWTDTILPEDISSPTSAAAYGELTFNSVTNGSCPMAWVIQKWRNDRSRSAFWRVIREMTKELGIADLSENTWSSRLVWSNLYKVAPDGGNPEGRLRSLQLPGCIALLRMELDIYRPRRLLLLTGLNWATPFLESFAPGVTAVSGYHYVEAIGEIGHDPDLTQVVVAAHPQGKNEATWVKEVMKGFQK